MENLTIVVPFYNGQPYLEKLLSGIPEDIQVLFVDDQSEIPLAVPRQRNVGVVRPTTKLYFTGAVNYGIDLCDTDVLVLNQDVVLTGTEWLDILELHRKEYAYIGERIRGNHPAFPHGYIHGVYQFMRRDAIDRVGPMDEVTYPLWGASALWQWQVCRKGYKALPLETVPGLEHWHHKPSGERFGPSIQTLLTKEPNRVDKYIRTPPMISVIVPCYNYGRYLWDCINSLFGGETSLGTMPGQTFQSFEVIIIDDGSTDITREIGPQLADGWNGVRYIRQPNSGLPVALNNAISQALGKYITVLSADDMRESWSLQDLYDAITRNPGRVIYDDMVTFAGGQRGQAWQLAEYDFENLLEKNMMHSGIMYEKEAWRNVGGYPVAFRNGREDWSFNVALGEKGYCGLKIPRSGYLYRRELQNRSLGNSTPEHRESFKIQIIRQFPHLYRGERSMACCGGGSKSSRTVSTPEARMARISSQVKSEDMVLMEYIGTSTGSQTWGGPGAAPSGRYYRFGKNPKDQIKYVEIRDVAWLEELRFHGLQVFRRYALPQGSPVQPMSQQPVKEEEEKDEEDDDGVETGTGGDVKPSGILRITKVQKPAMLEVPDPGTMTVMAIKELSLTDAQWEELLGKEKSGKHRISVIEHVRSILNA